MKNFIEKLKNVDKKVWIGVGIGAAVIVILIIALAIGLGFRPTGNQGSQGNQDVTQNDSQVVTETEENVTEVFGSEGLETEGTETEMSTETEVESEVESEKESESQATGNESSSQKPSGGGSTVTQNPDVGGVTQTPITTTPDGQEILGLGSKEQPYEVIPDIDTMSLKTVEVPAGKTLYYDIQRVGGLYFTIKDADAYVITSDGTRYDAKGGKVSFKVENALASDFVSFQIGNKSGSAKAFTIYFENPKGTQMNPEAISGTGVFKKHLEAGDEVGYHYKLNAAQSGKLRIYMSATKETEMNVQNNSGVATIAANFSEAQTDEKGEYIEISVNAGDEIRIHVQAVKQGRNTIPATDITFELVYN